MEQKIMHGKNLLHITKENFLRNGITFTNNGDGSITLNGTPTSGLQIDLTDKAIDFEINKTYTISVKEISGNVTKLEDFEYIFFPYENTLNHYAWKKDLPYTFTVREKGTHAPYLWIGYEEVKGAFVTFDNYTIAFQIEEGNIATEYEPYKKIVPIKMLKGKEENLQFLDVQDGQLIFTTDTKNIYLDNGSTREIYSSDGNSSFVAQEEPVTAINGDVWFVEEEKPSIKIVSFEEGTDDEIAAMLEAHYRGDIDVADHWKVGDSRTIHLNSISSPNTNEFTKTWPAQDIVINIVAMNHHKLKERNGVRDYAAITCQTRECLNNLANYGLTEGTIFVDLTYGTDTTFTKWSQLPMRTWMNGAFLTTCFSSKMQSMIKETVHNRLTTNGASSHTTEEVIDKIFLPSYTEIFSASYEQYLGGADVTPAYEGEQLEYYKTSSHRIKYANNNGQSNGVEVKWWHSSPSSDSSSGYKWGGVNTDGTATHANGYTGYGLVPAFCL